MKPTWVVVALLALLLTGCPNSLPNDLATLNSFPVQPESDGSYPTALTKGYLVIENGCIRLESIYGQSYVVYWPYNYSYVENVGNTVEILDDEGTLVTAVSATPRDFVEMGGGELRRDVSGGVCGGISWLSSGVEVVDPPSSLVAFPTNPNDTSGGNAAYAEGQLVNEDGCLRIRANDGTSTLIRWPYGYSYQDNSGNIVVFDADGKFKAALGDFIGLGGSETTATLPPGCDGPFWGAVSITVIDSPPE